MVLKDILKELIQSKGMTISALAKSTKVSPQTIHNWLSGAEPRSIKQVKEVAEYFNVSLDYLCFGESETFNQTVETLQDEIRAGVFEVILRKTKK